MAWYDSAVIYHIYPLGLCGCPHENSGSEGHCFEKLNEWARHAAELGFTCIYIGPLFESEGHGYETTDYRRVDRRLGTNEDFAEFVKNCHELNLKVIADGVFNHTGRSFFAFEDIRKHREASRYCGWYNINFRGNTEYNDGFSYDNWGGYNLLAKLNMNNPEVRGYHFDTVRFWVKEFDIDGIRLDAADVLDRNFMHELRGVTNTLKEDFWLMGEVIHGDYSRWANGDMLHSVTNYELHKGLYSGHNDHNYFEIAHSVKRLLGICGKTRLYTFADNHDVERIYSKLADKSHIKNVALLVYALPGIPSVYYGSEFGIEGKKGGGDDWALRPCLNLSDFDESSPLPSLIARLGQLKKEFKELTDGEYKELTLTTRQYSFARILGNSAVITVLNNDDAPAHIEIPLPVNASSAVSLLDCESCASCDNDSASQPKVKAVYTMSVTESASAAFDAAELADIMRKVNRAIEDGSDASELLRRAKTKLMRVSEDMKDIAVSEVDADSSPQGCRVTVSGGTSYHIEGGRLIVDIGANDGDIIYIK